jgi:hypothetical protein
MKRHAAIILACISLLLGLAVADDARDSSANKAAKAKLIRFSQASQVAGRRAPRGKIYVLLQTEWENIHPKQKVKKRDLEGKPDRTMGAGRLREGKKEEKKEDYIDSDVPYVVPNLFDHAYLLAEGQAYALDKLTEVIPAGYALNKEFTITKLGDRKTVDFVYLVPAEAKNIAFQFFDYSNGRPSSSDTPFSSPRTGSRPRFGTTG